MRNREPLPDGDAPDVQALHTPAMDAESLIGSLQEPHLILTPGLRVHAANPAFYAYFAMRPHETEGRLIYELGDHAWDIPALRRLLEDVLPGDHAVEDFEVRHTFDHLGERVLLLQARQLDHVPFLLLGFRDITGQKRAEEALHALSETLEERVEDRTWQLREFMRELTLSEQGERRRIARTLHDDLQQLLYGVEMKLSVLRKELRQAGYPQLAEDLEQARTWLNQAVTMTRNLTVTLSPPILQHEGLTGTLGWLQRQMEEVYGLELTIEAKHDFDLPDDDLRVLLFQIVRELLVSVTKHAGVERATVRLDETPDDLVIRVIEEGTGSDVAAVTAREQPDEGFGLGGVRERLGLLGGRLEVRSQPGVGTLFEVHAPIQPVRRR